MQAYSQLGQFIVTSNVVRRRTFFQTEALPPISFIFAQQRFRPRLRRPSYCPTEVSYHVDHTHRLYISQSVLSLGQVTFRTSVDNDHSHVVELTEQDVLALGYGGTVRKRTSKDARAGGSPHTHDVAISCVLSYGAYGAYGSPLSYGAYGFPFAYASLVPASVTIY
jgi:hypothetical protein